MRITLLTVGKLKEKYWKDAIDEYVKRLGRYAKVDIVEVADEKTPDNASEAEEEQIRRIEGARLLEKIPQGSYVITLEILGKMLDSVQLSETISDWMVKGESHLCFIIGGSLGLSKEVSARASYKLSFSKMTFPHQLMRVILLEQLYRAFRIQKGEPYHK
ncbi:MAG: 23S rRNA (pseudouridine(1915)-N(3))-methyltransferase RlmH [Firmicutes bacterium]|nr:23S rRNA (pseudouridine(1915)-N(3))-methyltransferase RlmH [Bacillota bacterium]